MVFAVDLSCIQSIKQLSDSETDRSCMIYLFNCLYFSSKNIDMKLYIG